MDVHNPAVRSKNMRAIAARDTAIERRVADLLTQLEVSFQVQHQQLPGRPDFVVSGYQAVIFTHGCFWHRHSCPMFKIPASRTAFWLHKINGNVLRDKRNIAQLHERNWRVLVIWECALRGSGRLSDQALCERMEEWLCAGDQYAQIDRQGLHRLLSPLC